ncbi:MAG: histidine phosphatase family protein [Geminicoccaceae bacterium]|nr:histidine phosphatase family protein [Geminicoccaceae bacterium]MCB9942142.1 histidine phosphatase family protein [Geminicoccaceae bacterium]
MLLIRHGESEWNVPFGAVRIDAGIPDPELTARGRQQAMDAAAGLERQGIRRIIASPYRRTLQTASIIAAKLGVDIEVEALVRERCAFSCDQGTSRDELQRAWPDLDFSALADRWWGARIESVRSIEQRAGTFLRRTETLADRDHILVVCHWGFILAATGQSVDNAAIVRVASSTAGNR